MPHTFHQTQMFQKTFFLEDGDALFLVPKDQQIIPRLYVKYLPCICRDDDLPFISHFYHAENVFSFGWHFQP